MLIKKVKDVPGYKINAPFERVIKILFSPKDDPSIDFTFLITNLKEKNGKTALHKHEESGELMYIKSSFGEVILGDQIFTIEPDTVFYAPPGMSHEVRNYGNESMKILCFFSPAVSESYMKEMQLQAKHANLG